MGTARNRAQPGTAELPTASSFLSSALYFTQKMKGKQQKVAKEDPGDPQGDTAELLPTAPRPPAGNTGSGRYGERSRCPNHACELSCSQQARLIFFPRLIQFLG